MGDESNFQGYEEIIKRNPQLEGIVDPDSWNYVGKSNKTTGEGLGDLWRENVRRNIKRQLWKRYGSLQNGCLNLGRNKAIIGVGAGASFNKNKDVLKTIADLDGVKDWKDRNFIIMASNHQFKPLIKMGIIPDFVALVDGSDDILPQLTEDIPPPDKCGTILLTTLGASPTMLKRWVRQGRELRFYLPSSVAVQEEFKKITGKDPDPHTIVAGGNILNTMFLLGVAAFGSSTFFAVGNDLSYALHDDIEKRREMFYADGDYATTQMQKGRDEAKQTYHWMGFSLERPIIYTGPSGYKYSLSPVGTTYNFWVYKTWMEAWLLANMGRKDLKYHYYNCSEGGIFGVMCKPEGKNRHEERDWYLLDDVCKQYHTMMLEDAANQFVIAKEAMKWPTGVTTLDVPSAIDLARQPTVDTAKSMLRQGKIIGI